MFLGEKLWEGNGKTLQTTVKDQDSYGATLEFTWVAKLKGFGKAQGLNVTISFTATKVANFFGAGPTVGQGVLFTNEGNMVAIKSSGYGKPQGGRGRSVEIWSFKAKADKLDWLSNAVAIVTIDGDDQWKDFSVTINEWSPS